MESPISQNLDPTSIEYTEFLSQRLSIRLDLLQRLQTLANSQSEANSNSDINVLLGLLSRKQSILDELAELHVQLKPYFQDDSETRNWVSPERREACRKIADEGNRLLQSIMQQDNATLNEMVDRRDAIAAQLQDGTDSILAHTAYTADNALLETELDINDA